jgi:acyl-CoA synthetase (NDP forming)
MIASATAAQYADTLEAVLADPAVDMALAINVTPLLTSPHDVLAAVTSVAARHDKPVLAVMMATEDFYDAIKLAPDHPPVYRFPESAARAMQMLARYAAWRGRPEPGPPPDFAVDDEAVARLLATVDDGYLPPDAAFGVLEAYGVPVARWRFVAGAGSAAAGGAAPEAAAVAAAAAEIGFPVVVKAEAPGLVHKSDIGAVAVGLEDAAAVERAVGEMHRRLAEHGLEARGFLVQQLVRGGHEVIFGITTDPRFGPLLAFGLGGRYVEVFQDVRFGVTPLDRQEAHEMVRGIRGFPLLSGVRGEAAADLDLLEEVLLRLAQLAQRHPRVRELDVNPFLAAPGREGAVAVDVRLRVGLPPG